MTRKQRKGAEAQGRKREQTRTRCKDAGQQGREDGLGASHPIESAQHSSHKVKPAGVVRRTLRPWLGTTRDVPVRASLRPGVLAPLRSARPRALALPFFPAPSRARVLALPFFPASWRPGVFAFLLVIFSCVLSGCGYVRVKVTASPVPPTPTAPVHLATPVRRATATAIPSTPLPTSTPTPTPTPIVHIVQEGELLIHIASQYNADMQAIIEVNHITNPNSLPIGQRLIIPRSEQEARALQPTATPTPMPLHTVRVGLHRTPAGSLWCMGEVENERDEALDLVRLEVTLYNAGGEVLDRAAAFIAADIVPGHGVAPFAILLANAPAAGYASYEIQVLSAQPITQWGRRHRELTVEELHGEMDQGALNIQGIVRNRGEADAERVRITFTAYGDDDTVVGVRQADLSLLAAGEAEPVSLSLVPASPAVRVEAVAWGMKTLD